ncbi:MAG: hypothetical protein ACK4SY_06835 [Pyrobaculum sp.]
MKFVLLKLGVEAYNAFVELCGGSRRRCVAEALRVVSPPLRSPPDGEVVARVSVGLPDGVEHHIGKLCVGYPHLWLCIRDVLYTAWGMGVRVGRRLPDVVPIAITIDHSIFFALRARHRYVAPMLRLYISKAVSNVDSIVPITRGGKRMIIRLERELVEKILEKCTDWSLGRCVSELANSLEPLDLARGRQFVDVVDARVTV